MYKEIRLLIIFSAATYFILLLSDFELDSNVNILFFLTYNIISMTYFVMLTLAPSNFTAVMSLVLGVVSVICYVFVFLDMNAIPIYKYASDTLEYHKFASTFVSGNVQFQQSLDYSDFGTFVYVGILYAIIESPIIVYFMNLFLLYIISIDCLRCFGDNMNPISKRFFSTLCINPVFIYLALFLFKECVMLFLIYMCIRNYFLKRNYVLIVLSLIALIFFRPVITIFLVISIILSHIVPVLIKMISQLRISVNNALFLSIISIISFFLIDVVLLEIDRMMARALFVVYDYYSSVSAFGSHSFLFVLVASLLTAFLGPIPDVFTSNDIALPQVYSAGTIFLTGSIIILIKSIKARYILTSFPFIFFLINNLSVAVILRGFDIRFTIIGFFVLFFTLQGNKSTTTG